MKLRSFLSVVVIFLNERPYINEAIESVIAQTFDHWEFFLVDDGSPDGSSETAKMYEAQNSGRVKYFEHEDHQNLGMSASRNLGIRNVKGEYLAFLIRIKNTLPQLVKIT